MSEAQESSSTSSVTRKPITLPDWVPNAVVKQVRRIEAQPLSAEQQAMLLRLATDTRMRSVWTELTRRKRPSGHFLHPAKRPSNRPTLTQDNAQDDELAFLFFFVLCAARDQVPAWKAEELTAKKSETIQRARVLRELADELSTDPFYSTEPLAVADAAVLLRVARWLETLVATARPTSDPLIIEKDRGNRRMRALQILCAAQLMDTFGNRLDGTAARSQSLQENNRNAPCACRGRRGIRRATVRGRSFRQSQRDRQQGRDQIARNRRRSRELAE